MATTRIRLSAAYMPDYEHSVSSMTRRQIRAAPIVVAALTFFAFELTLRSAPRVIPAAAVLPIFYFLVIALLLGSGLKTRLARFKFLIAPTVLSISALAFLLLVEAPYLRHVIALIVAIVLVFFFESLAIVSRNCGNFYHRLNIVTIYVKNWRID